MENLNKFTNSRNLGEIDIVNSRKKGSLLEWVIKRIFQVIGFYATNKVVINDNQIDVFVNYNDIKIVAECKQYEKNTPPVKDLIHEWNSKRKDIECDKALLVLWGYPKINQDELKLAKKLDVNLWNDALIFNFFNLVLSDVTKARKEILLNLNIDNDEAQKIIQSLKDDIKSRFNKFSLDDRNSVDSLKNEILGCFKNGSLIKQKKFEIMWEFLKEKEFYIGPSTDHMYGINSDDSIFKYKSEFEIRKFIKRDKIYKRGEGIIGIANVDDEFDSILPDAVDKDGVRLIKSKQMFN